MCGPKRSLKGRVPCHSSEIHHLRDGFPAIGELSSRVLVSGRPTHAEFELDRRAAQDRCGEQILAVERFGGGRLQLVVTAVQCLGPAEQELACAAPMAARTVAGYFHMAVVATSDWAGISLDTQISALDKTLTLHQPTNPNLRRRGRANPAHISFGARAEFRTCCCQTHLDRPFAIRTWLSPKCRPQKLRGKSCKDGT